MGDAKHTLGPWRVDCEGDELVIVGPRANHNRRGENDTWEVCRIDNAHFWDVTGVEETDRANARLIATAPDLVEALDPEPDMPEAIKPLSWLRSLIDDARERGPAADCDDADAYQTMLAEVESLHDRLRAALSKAGV